MFHQAILVLFYFFAAIAIWLGLLSLRGGLRFAHYLQTELAKDPPDFTPFVTVYVPCRGLDQGLAENITAMFAQDYPSFELIFVSDRADDPALAVVAEVRQLFTTDSGPAMRWVISGTATGGGQKVHNLRAAVQETSLRSEVFAFVDSDARPHPKWLRFLVAPLQDETLGAATGYRWFIPVRGLASHLLSVWNASITSALGAHGEKNFCWGGSTAIRRATFEKLDMAERWRGTVSDDFTMTRVLHEAGLAIKFVPQCLTASFEDCSFGKLLEFTTRQLKITRVYAAHLWQGVLTGSLFFVLVFFGGLALITARALMGLSFATPLLLLSIIFVLGALKSHLRLHAVRLVINDRRVNSSRTTLAHLLLWPLASALYLYNALAALVSRRINWRGIIYELKSPTETVIIRHE